MGSRRHDIDWLRTLASYLVVVYHAAQFFDFQKKTYFKNNERSTVLDFFTRFVHLWHMPLFFLLAGWASKFSLESRGARIFLLERVQRLLVPLVFGLLVLCAPPRWVEFKNGLWKTGSGEENPRFQLISFHTFLRAYYYTEGISWNHLWFLAYLFTFSVIYLPGFWLLSKVSMSGWGHQKWGWVLMNAPVVFLSMVQLRLRDRWPGYQNLVDDWANFWFYSIFFIAGFCLAQYRGLEDTLHLSWKRNGALGFLSGFIYIFSQYLSHLFFVKPDAIQHVLSAFAAWYLVCFLLSFARRNLSNFQPPAFWSENAFPVYIIHDVPLCLIADSMLARWAASVGLKFMLSSTASLLSSLLFLSAIVNRVRLFRFLLGMKDVESVLSQECTRTKYE